MVMWLSFLTCLCIHSFGGPVYNHHHANLPTSHPFEVFSWHVIFHVKTFLCSYTLNNDSVMVCKCFSISLALCIWVTGGFPLQRTQQCGALIILLCQPGPTMEQAVPLHVIWDVQMLNWSHCKGRSEANQTGGLPHDRRPNSIYTQGVVLWVMKHTHEYFQFLIHWHNGFTNWIKHTMGIYITLCYCSIKQYVCRSIVDVSHLLSKNNIICPSNTDTC